jgi:amino acid transporter
MARWENPLKLLTGGLAIFVAYEGFELISNAVPDIENPVKNVPKAYYYSVIFVILLYVIIGIVTVGSLSFKEIAIAQDYALAEAARPMLGKTGFMIITIAALISTFSAINATLYGSSRVSYEIAEAGELPHYLTAKLWNHPIGLMITAILTLALVNSLELESISTAGSIGFLLIFSLVNLIGFKLSSRINGNRFISLSGFLLCIIAVATLTEQQYSSNKMGVITAAAIIAACFLLEWIYKKNVPGNVTTGKAGR